MQNHQQLRPKLTQKGRMKFWLSTTLTLHMFLHQKVALVGHCSPRFSAQKHWSRKQQHFENKCWCLKDLGTKQTVSIKQKVCAYQVAAEDSGGVIPINACAATHPEQPHKRSQTQTNNTKTILSEIYTFMIGEQQFNRIPKRNLYTKKSHRNRRKYRLSDIPWHKVHSGIWQAFNKQTNWSELGDDHTT